MPTRIQRFGLVLNNCSGFFRYHANAWVCLLLFLVTIAVYGQTRNFEFLSFDDNIYITDNAQVKSGLSLEGLAWSFSFEGKDKTYWHPLSWLSHMIDVELFGLNPAGHHLMNVAIHIISGGLLFLTLAQWTGSRWRSFFVAALFAVHPINVESVAWVAERKNVLSTAFWMIIIYVYIWYACKPGMMRYGALMSVFTLGLLTKPMLVTLPFVLLLIDYWPLGRWSIGSRRPETLPMCFHPPSSVHRLRVWELVKEKIPLLFLSILVAYLASESLQATGTVISLENIPLIFRLLNCLVSYVEYIVKIIWPSDLAVFYPYPRSISIINVGLAVLVLLGISAYAFRNMAKRPYFIVGWMWFLGTLVPVSGIIQAGLWPALADRWAYIPSIGLFILLVWGSGDIVARSRKKTTRIVTAAAVLILSLLSVVGYRQAAVWTSDISLFQDALSKSEGNFAAHYKFGMALYKRNIVEEAFYHFHEAAKINPEYCFPYYTLALQLYRKIQPDKAEVFYQKALSLNTETAFESKRGLHILCESENIFRALTGCRIVLGKEHFKKVIHNNIGIILVQLGRTKEAISSFQEALRIDPGYVDCLNNIGFAYLKAGQVEESIQYFEKALAIEPQNRIALKNFYDGMIQRQIR